MINENNRRITITLSKEVIKEIDVNCKKIGVSRSSYCANLIAQKILKMEEKK